MTESSTVSLEDTHRLVHLTRELATLRSFETAAQTTLKTAAAIAQDALARSSFASRGAILRALVHVRPAQGYRRVSRLELERGQGDPSAQSFVIPSQTAWTSMERTQRPVAMDVLTGHVRTLGAATPATSDSPLGSWSTVSGVQLNEGATFHQLVDRDTTHVFCAPLRHLDGDLGGMLVLEARCRAALGTPFVWSECASAIELLSALSAPSLLLHPSLPSQPTFPSNGWIPVLGEAMTGVLELLHVFARWNDTLLLRGETGVGKSRLARVVHSLSERKQKPFVVADLLSIPEELQSAELFGWKRGAFTGAIKDTAGMVKRAEGGTLFLDEVDKLSLRAQSGLLRLLEERSYRVVGDDTVEHRADVRFIAGTNVDLHAAVRAGTFREDLLYRLLVLPVYVPALRERRDEIAPWSEWMLSQLKTELGAEIPTRIASDALRLLTEQPWPGNLRQLHNVVRRACAYATVRSLRAQPGSSTLALEDVARALSVETQTSAHELRGDGVLHALAEAARGFLSESQRRVNRGEPALSLEHAQAWEGVILREAIALYGSREAAFEALGLHELVKNRNHHRTLKRALQSVDDLRRLLGATMSTERVEDNKP